MTSPIVRFRKLWAIFVIYLHECFAYPAASAIWVVVDVQVALILPAVWLAAGEASIGSLSRSEMVTYYLASTTLSQFITCHLMWDIAEDIREGLFASHIVRPMSHFAASAARNLSWRVAKLVLFVPVALIVYSVYFSFVQPAPLYPSWQFLAAVVLAHSLSFASAYCMAMIALWTTEYVSFLRLYYVPETFLSGRYFPISALPGIAVLFSSYTHFRYTNAFPVEVLLGKLSPAQMTQGLVVQAGWFVFFLLLGRVLFQRGSKRYTGVGM